MDNFPNRPAEWVIAIAVLFVSLIASGHAILRKRDPRSSLWWVSLNVFVPFVGPVLYYFFGINRIERKASRLRKKNKASMLPMEAQQAPSPKLLFPENIQHLERLSKTLDTVLRAPLLCGNTVLPLIDGDNTYPHMLQAIRQSKKSIGLSVYIFNHDDIGKMFIDELAEAAKRGVQVRVLIDDVGIGFFTKSVVPHLRKKNIKTAIFLPTLMPPKMAHINLRNHRKILTVDGLIAYTGGMNISDSHRMSSGLKNYCKDIHFRMEGPVVVQIQDAFRLDWNFTTGEDLSGSSWFPMQNEKGTVEARAIPDGPDENIGKTRWAIIGALAHAQKSVQIMTPYFIPDAGLITALQMAVLNGVSVDIFLPEANDSVFVQWASRATLWQVLEIGCRVWEMPPPFHHSKLMLVDGGWVLLGSSNWDARSLRLNFEFNVECYDVSLAETIQSYFYRHKLNAREIKLEDMDKRSLPVKLRDGFARLFSPVL